MLVLARMVFIGKDNFMVYLDTAYFVETEKLLLKVL